MHLRPFEIRAETETLNFRSDSVSKFQQRHVAYVAHVPRDDNSQFVFIVRQRFAVAELGSRLRRSVAVCRQREGANIV